MVICIKAWIYVYMHELQFMFNLLSSYFFINNIVFFPLNLINFNSLNYFYFTSLHN
jgi:hypothetical protein